MLYFYVILIFNAFTFYRHIYGSNCRQCDLNKIWRKPAAVALNRQLDEAMQREISCVRFTALLVNCILTQCFSRERRRFACSHISWTSAVSTTPKSQRWQVTRMRRTITVVVIFNSDNSALDILIFYTAITCAFYIVERSIAIFNKHYIENINLSFHCISLHYVVLVHSYR